MNYYGKAESVLEKVAAAFESGNVGKAIATIFINRTGRHVDGYSWSNQILVALAGWSDAMGFKQWLAVGRCVKKGSKATYILKPYISKRKGINGGEDKTFIRGFGTVAVFGVEQTDVVDEVKWTEYNKDNEEAAQFVETLPFAEVAKAWGYTIGTYNAKNSGALGWHRRGAAIAVGVTNLDVWAHELMHAADHKNGTLTETAQHWRSEVVAEVGSTVLMLMMGYESEADLGGAYKYVKQYAAKVNKTPGQAAMECLNRICKNIELLLKTAAELGVTDLSPTDTDVTMAQTGELVAA